MDNDKAKLARDELISIITKNGRPDWFMGCGIGKNLNNETCVALRVSEVNDEVNALPKKVLGYDVVYKVVRQTFAL